MSQSKYDEMVGASTSTVAAPVGKSLTASEMLDQMRSAMLQAARLQVAQRTIDPIEAYLRANIYGQFIYESPFGILSSDCLKPATATEKKHPRLTWADSKPVDRFPGFTVKSDTGPMVEADKSPLTSSPDLAGEWKPFEFGSAHLSKT